MSTPQAPDQLLNSTLNNYSCLPCRQRKIKCDRHSPCSHCVKAERQCSFIAPVRGKRKRTKPPREGLHAKLRRYEELLRSYGAKLEPSIEIEDTDSETASQPDTERLENAETPGKVPNETLGVKRNSARLVTKAEASRYFDSTLWSSLGEEVKRETITQYLHDPSNYVEFQHPDAADLSEHGDGPSTFDSELYFSPEQPFKVENLASLHPPMPKLTSLKDIYVDRVDPLMKILHIPTFWTMVTNALRNPSDMPKSLQAMIFAFYIASISTMDDGECQALFGASASVLCRQYRAAARQALMHAGFMSTSSPMTLRAYTMFIVGIRKSYPCDTMFVLSAVAIRLARKMGLHRDGTALGLSLFDTEMRRRLWWHLVHMDYKTADTLGIKPSLDLFSGDAKIPWNVNDEDLHPDMTQPPQERSSITSISICLMKCEVTQALRKFSRLAPADTLADPNIPHAQKDRVIAEIEETLESKYFRYCDLINPLHTFISIMGRSAICKMKLFTYNARRMASRNSNAMENERNIMFTNATKLLEYATLIEYGPHDLRRYLWHVSTSYFLNIILYVLIEVRRRKTGPEVNRSWKLIETALSQYPQILKTSTGIMYTALSKWTLEAWDEYVAASKAEGLTEPATPEYVNVIRRYRRSVSAESSRANHLAAEGGVGGRTLPDMDFESLEGALPDDEHFGFSDFPTISSFEIDPGEWVQWDQVVGGEGGFPFTQGMSDFPN